MSDRPLKIRCQTLRCGSSRRRLLTVALVLACTGVLPQVAQAFSPDVHRIMTVRTLRGQIKHGTVLPPDLAALMDFYSWLGWSLAKRGGDEAGKARFRAMYPERQDFDAIGIRRLLSLSLDPNIEVWGISSVTKEAEPDRFSVAADACARPIMDRRDHNRVAVDASFKPEIGRFGAEVPLDPRALNFGPASGDGSGAWAHTALPTGLTSTHAAPSSGHRVVPFMPGLAVRGGAAEMAQLHMDMSVLAMYWGDSQFKQTAEYMSLVWLGAALHYVQEAASPLHNVQLGSPELLANIARRHWVAALKSGGGLWRPLPNPVIGGLRVRRNLRIIGDRWLSKQVSSALDDLPTSPAIASAMANLQAGDQAFDDAVRPGLEPWLQRPTKTEPSAKGRGAISVLVDSLAAAGAEDGARLYDALMAVSAPTWTTGETLLAEHGALKQQPWQAGSATAWADIEEIQGRALRRGAAATTLAFDAWLNGNPHAALDRLRRVRTIALLQQAPARKAWDLRARDPRWVRDPRWAAGEGAALALVLLLLYGLWRRRRRP
ncbi:MAG: hypothetical protein KC502_08095 [Myxococcales bacterium]|nr:hypothetical protein [Myxococcales bacterium]